MNVGRLAREFDPLSGETAEDTWNDFYGSDNPVMAFYDYFSELFRELGPSKYLKQLSEQASQSLAMQKVRIRPLQT